MIKDVILGIDTSNYTTSVAVVGFDGELIANLKRPLPVKAGERGLRQSDDMFSHTVNLPEIMSDLKKHTEGCRIVSVGVSDRPRNVSGSYMPCFLAGVASAVSISSCLGIPIYRFSHQCGHIMAALTSSGRTDLLDCSFVAFHVSGGTTEMLWVTPDKNGFSTDIIGGTKDLNAGQVIDRIGVHLGLPFPAGRYVEELALQNVKKIPKRKLSTEAGYVNLSGLENMAVRLYDDTGDKALVCAFVLDYIGRALVEISDNYRIERGDHPYVYAGGVMSNSIIKKMLSEGRDAAFAEPALSADNAVGVAMLALRAYKSENF